MPVHDWTRVEGAIFHDFHHSWIHEMLGALNRGLLPHEYYAMAAPQASGFGSDILLSRGMQPNEDEAVQASVCESSAGLLVAPPRVRFTAQSDREFYRRKKSTIAVRHVSNDRIIAVVEVISPGNKTSKSAFKALVDKVYELLEHRIHLLILDLFPPTKRDPQGIHAVLWEDIADEQFTPPADKPLALMAYESGLTTKAYIEPLAVGDQLTDMPLFLEPGAYVLVPLEQTCQSAFAATPRRWQRVLEPPVR